MSKPLEKFRAPSRFEHWFNALVALLGRFGITFKDGYRMIVKGRKSGKEFAVAVTVLSLDGKQYLVAPRGETQWVRNVRVVRQVRLEKGARVNEFHSQEIDDEQKLVVLSAYLSEYRKAVQRYFPIPAGSEPDAFKSIANSFPTFLLVPA